MEEMKKLLELWRVMWLCTRDTLVNECCKYEGLEPLKILYIWLRLNCLARFSMFNRPSEASSAEPTWDMGHRPQPLMNLNIPGPKRYRKGTEKVQERYSKEVQWRGAVEARTSIRGT